MSEPGELPVEEPFLAKVDDDEKEDGEVLATAVVDELREDDSAGSLVVADVVVANEPSTTIIPEDEASSMPAALAAPTTDTTMTVNNGGAGDDDDDEEDGEIVEADAAPQAMASTDEMPTATEDKVKEEEKAAPLPDRKEKETPSETFREVSATTTSDSMPVAPNEADASATKDEVRPKQEAVAHASTETGAPTQDPSMKETTVEAEVKAESPEKAEVNTTTETSDDRIEGEEQDAENGQVEMDEVEDGEIEADKPKAEKQDVEMKPSPKGMDQELKPNSRVESVEVPEKIFEDKKFAARGPIVEQEALEEKTAEPGPEPAPMEIEEAKPKESEMTASASSVKKEDDKDDEAGEIKEDTEEEEEVKDASEEEGESKDDTEEEGEIKDDVEMEDALSPSEEGGDHDAETASPNDADTASVDEDADSVAEDPKKVEPSYSTRGRASTNSGTTTPVPRDSAASGKGSNTGSVSGGNSDQWERSVRDALEGLGRGGKETPLAGPGGSSFLEALGEDDRRTRTRFLPAVDGVHMLRKNEIKGDLSLARSIMSNAGNVASVASVAGTSTSSGLAKKSKSKKKSDAGSGEAEAMDLDDSNLSVASEDDRSSDSGRVGNASSMAVEDGGLLALPSPAFVPPLAATQSISTTSANGEKKEDGTPASVSSTGVKGILNNQRNIKSPRVVESVTAFNPPRPPESVGKKKQHRMLRWERRPADVEVDLNNYRKTVDRTRKELHTAEDELERIESTSNHFRRHFMHHLRYMDQEYEKIMDELDTVQQQCVSGADLLTSRTRTRGAGKGGQVMRDVLAVLKSRGAEVGEKGLSLRSDSQKSNGVQKNHPGFGGVGAASFADWHQHSVIPSNTIASAWVLPDDKVDTPYGEGIVVKVFDTAALNVKEPPLEEAIPRATSNGQSPSKMDVDSPAVVATGAKGAASKKSKSTGAAASPDDLSTTLGPRICVRFPFGIGYFSPAAVTSKESPNTLSDAQLAKRWKGLVETALSQSGQLDLEGMALPLTAKSEVAESNEASEKAESTMDGDNQEKNPEDIPVETKLLPFGSSLLPTGTGRGNMLSEMNALQLHEDFKPVFTEGGGVLGDEANEGVPTDVKAFEVQKQESYILQAKVLHLRNQLYRQRRIRTLNERTFAATRDRSARVESLAIEMRTDLKSLRNRLDEELKELGLDHDRAEAILKTYYLSQEYDDQELDEGALDEEESPTSMKRSREDLADGKQDQSSDIAAESTGDSEEPQNKRVKVANQ